MVRFLTHPSEIVQELRRLKPGHPLNPEDMVSVLTQLAAYYHDPLPLPPRVCGSQLDAAYQRITPETLTTLRHTCHQLEKQYQSLRPRAQVTFGEGETVQGHKVYPVRRVGIYWDGQGEQPLGDLLRLAMVAKTLGVEEQVLMVGQGMAPGVLVAAQEMGIQEIYPVEGVAAIALLTWGQDGFEPVETLVGPGPGEVMAAKQGVSPWVQIDRAVTATDLWILAQEERDAPALAHTLITYATQDPQARLVVLTDNIRLGETLAQELRQARQERSLSIATEKAIAHYGLIGVVEDLGDCLPWINQFSPHALHLWLADPWIWVEKIRPVPHLYLGRDTDPLTAEYGQVWPFLRYRHQGQRWATQITPDCFLRSSQWWQGGNGFPGLAGLG